MTDDSEEWLRELESAWEHGGGRSDGRRWTRDELHERGEIAPREVNLPTCGGNGTKPGVNLDDSAALLELMESEDDGDRRARVGTNQKSSR